MAAKRTSKTTQIVSAPVEGSPCNLTECSSAATVRGLCETHWATHRGLASPNSREERSDD